MKKCYVIGAGDIRSRDLSFEKRPGDLVVAADAGYRHLEKAGMVPDLLIGDFDSTARPDFKGETIVLPVVKDDTDVGYAIKEGLRRGYKEFVLIGCLGGKRISHSLANIQLLSYLRSFGANGALVLGTTKAFIIDGVFEFDEKQSGSLSLFVLSERAELTISGAKYELDKASVDRIFPLGVSNSFVGKKGYVKVASGEVLAVVE